MGDSHVTRLARYQHELLNHLSGVSLRFTERRGAGIWWGERNAHAAMDVDVVVLMLGGNDLDSGMSATQLADRIGHLGRQMVDQYRAQTVVITSQWPRTSQQYNLRAREFASIMERRHLGDEAVTFWLWDRRQPWRNRDGTHLTDHGYRTAVRYLQAIIVWAAHHNLW